MLQHALTATPVAIEWDEAAEDSKAAKPPLGDEDGSGAVAH